MLIRTLGHETLFIGRSRRLSAAAARKALDGAAALPGGIDYLRDVLAQQVPRARIDGMSDAEVIEALANRVTQGLLTVLPLGPPEVTAPPLLAQDPASEAEAEPLTEEEEDHPEEWLEIELLDDGDPPRPIAGAKYRVELDNGVVLEGYLDEDGKKKFEGLSKAGARVTFPDFDDDAWEKR